MVVYADVLIVLNLFVNFFILQLTCRICKESYRLGRLILASLTGAAFSLYIFLPPTGMLTETVFRLVISSLIVLLAFGFSSIKSLIRRVAVFFAVSFLYAGAMMGIWAIWKPNRLAINNGVVYVDISPTVLIIATLVSYTALSVIRFFAAKQAYAGKRCRLKITYNDKSVCLTALVDTGHSLTDALSQKDVIIIEKSLALKLCEKIPTAITVPNDNTPNGFRLIPYSVVGGTGLLPAFLPDKVELLEKEKSTEIKSVLLGISEVALGEDYKGIVSPVTLAK
ncbi:MAG: sigma-E processing peptidase SpoIIGA [Clostridia bacterium]|nr:sigma-E processing peptidase SpoIIGA [Clostridia bacterium]